MGLEKTLRLFGLSNMKQGIKTPQPVDDSYTNYDEYETYIDPECGCTRTRLKIKEEIIKSEQLKNIIL